MKNPYKRFRCWMGWHSGERYILYSHHKISTSGYLLCSRCLWCDCKARVGPEGIEYYARKELRAILETAVKGEKV